MSTDDEQILEKARALRSAADELQRLAVDISAMWRMSEAELKAAKDVLLQTERTLKVEREKLAVSLAFYNKVKDEYQIEMCNCGGIVDLTDEQQAKQKACKACIEGGRREADFHKP